MRQSGVYFVAYDEPEYRKILPFIKIGKTTDLQGRMQAFQTGSPIKIGVVGFVKSKDAHTLEHALHNRFGKDRIAGEWFRRSAGMVSSIRANYVVEGDRFDEFIDPPESHDVKIQKLEEENAMLRSNLRELEIKFYHLESKVPRKHASRFDKVPMRSGGYDFVESMKYKGRK